MVEKTQVAESEPIKPQRPSQAAVSVELYCEPRQLKEPMTRPSIEAAYDVAKLVYQGALSPSIAAKRLETENGFNVNSARDLIMVYRQLMRGESFHRGLSAPDMDYFLLRIGAEFGHMTLQKAVDGLLLHLRYYEGIRKVTMRKLRAVAVKHQARSAVPETLQQFEATFGEAVRRSLGDTPEKRRSRLKAAPRIPTRTAVVSFAFERNPDVVAEVLHRANGQCEQCKKAAPFLRRRDNSPYLEVHHLVQLAHDGEDTVENAAALCPNCHRKFHHGFPGDA
ncbi:MAG: HNH endonuclease [Alcaligenaceae bacterium]|nr:MAG: HNH endonuclease [Alcaligenaceae bacterium]